MKTNKNSGFTLIEIMIVVGIIGLLAAMAIPAVQKVRENNIHKKINSGQYVTQKEKAFYYSNPDNSKPTYVESGTTTFDGEIVINGKSYWIKEKK